MVNTDNKARVVLAWSSGKDSAWALHQLEQSDEYELAGLLTTVNEEFERVAMHAVRQELLEEQARLIGLPLTVVNIPWPCSNEDYEQRMASALETLLKEERIKHVAFGDLFLEDIRQYREDKMQDSCLTPLFPLWGKNTRELAEEMLTAGVKAIITCIDPRKLDQEFAGRIYDHQFLKDIDADVDPCGENGEFHTFVFDGPIFERALDIKTGEIVEREGFVFADILSAAD